MLKLVMWLLLLVVSWPLALLALIAWPFVWLLSLPFRFVGVSLGALFDLVEETIRLPARLIGGAFRPSTT
jgi:hypothetical protein